jgi:hypothetical protein
VCISPEAPTSIVTELLDGDLLKLATQGDIKVDMVTATKIISSVVAGMLHLHVMVCRI